MSDPVFPTVFTLQPYGSTPALNILIITPQGTDPKVVTSAWSYAVRYTAKGLDLPDHDAALELMLKRHPSWKLIKSLVQAISVNLPLAEKDEPETR